MKALFVHDHVFVRWKDQIYSPGRLPYAAFQRYLEVFGELQVIARTRDAAHEGEVASLQRSDGPHVAFTLFKKPRGLTEMLGQLVHHQRVVRREIDAADALIARLPSALGVRAVRMAKRAGIPIAVEVVQSALEALWHHGSPAAKLYAPILHAQTRRSVARAGHALYVTREFLQRKYPCANHTAVASNVVLPEPDHNTLQNRLNRLRSREHAFVRMGFVGTLDARHKGLDTALQALARIPSDITWTFEIVGEGHQQSWKALSAKLGIARQVRFVGTLPGSAAVREWLRGIDIYLQPSRSEGLPRALIEAMSEGCAAIASSVSGIPELLGPDYLHRPGDAESLGRIAVRLARDPAFLEVAAHTNITEARQYTLSKLVQARREFFSSFERHVRSSSDSLQATMRGS